MSKKKKLNKKRMMDQVVWIHPITFAPYSFYNLDEINDKTPLNILDDYVRHVPLDFHNGSKFQLLYKCKNELKKRHSRNTFNDALGVIIDMGEHRQI